MMVATSAAPALARAWWKKRIDHITAGKSFGIVVADDGRIIYRRAAKARRIPASNQKLLFSMALFARLSPDETLETIAAAETYFGGVVSGDLYVLGHGDPAISGGGRFDKTLSFEPTRVKDLARALVDAGVTRIEGSVVGSTSYFSRDWWATGWKYYFPSRYVALPTALTFKGNVADGRHIRNPEWRMARALTRRLRGMGVVVGSSPKASEAPEGLLPIAQVTSQPLATLVRHMNVRSSNFFAETLGKRLGVEFRGRPGSISKGAAATRAWAAANGVQIDAYDASGLSYGNRVSAQGMARMLTATERQPWGTDLRDVLAGAGEGTLENRLKGVRIRAKTGTLSGVSALSGYVWLRKDGSWAEFSILSRGLSKSHAVGIEDRIVRLVTKYGR